MSAKPRVLIVDDEPDVVANWARLLGREDYPCVTATDGERALALLESERPDVVLTDLKMPRVDGMQILARALELDPDVVVIMITGHGTVESAVEAMRAGAFDYLLKPLPGARPSGAGSSRRIAGSGSPWRLARASTTSSARARPWWRCSTSSGRPPGPRPTS
jgi:DNA-binding NtrC family response regulator